MANDGVLLQNDGVILGRKVTDFIAGTLPYRVNITDGNWTPYVPKFENQFSNNADSMGCVTYSALNCIETQERFITGTEVNYSDRWIAKMSGTTHQGNYLYKVMDTIRQYGLVLEEDYPTPDNFDWDTYYAEIPTTKFQELIKKGQEWLTRWQVNYEWLTVSDPQIDYHLKHAPIQVVIPGHAIEGIYSPDDWIRYFDTYPDYLKSTPISNLQDALKIVLTRKEQTMEILQVVGEPTLVVKNLDGKYYQIATAPELYPFVAKTLGLEGKVFGTISRADVDLNLGGELTAGLSFISK